MSDSSNAALADAPSDVAAVISRLYVYPVKSCAGVQVEQAILLDTGLEFDRAWMVVDGQGSFLTQRELPRMALIKPQLKHFEMILRAPGMLALHIALDQVEAPARVTLWKDEVAAYDMGPLAAQWFTDFLGVPARLVRFDPEHKRISSLHWTDGIEALNQFNDGYPVLVISEASLLQFNAKLAAQGFAAVGMERFRPNIVLGDASQGLELMPHDEDRLDLLQIATEQGPVRLKPVKPCPRCPIPNIDPATALSSPEVGDLLQGYRQDARVGGAVTFGMNAIVLQGIDHLLRVGQSVGASYHFD
ncbi:MOSC domain-containing protein [Polaromonas naphthalenivorans]|uniref:MOSC domain protein beta barrel domain protein n=1 Tax=Polaromonas naphthalenivorans (strain CJ2) TaxID=365044 RepID=A1VSN4_POLNA|nr:MOSC N-terminal beta barrel domain-containing protein [Polaromonas naphthalenivorans]ABM38662.1 MOSC domain protein beta barrel domain protein [Polaromonas naphthalenivorans CJ2]